MITIPINLIAPCGMNCILCWGYIREKNRCPGCLINENQKSQNTAPPVRSEIANKLPKANPGIVPIVVIVSPA